MTARHCWDGVVGEQELRWAAEDYGVRHPPRPPAALLLIDLFNKAFGDRREPLAASRQRHPSSCGEAAWDALEPLQRLLHGARQAGGVVVHTTAETRREARVGSATRRARRADDPWSVAIVAPLRPRPGELVVYKSAPSAFFATALDTHLRRHGVGSLVVAGETTSGCVRASVVDAYSLGFDVLVVEDATFDRSALSHAVNLFDMHHKYATVVDTAEALAQFAVPLDVADKMV